MNQDRTLQEAARRHARLQAHDCSPSEGQTLLEWEAENEEQAKASALSRRVLTNLDSLAAHDDFARKLQAMTDEALNAYPEPCAASSFAARPLRWAAGLAAGFAVAIVGWQLHSGQVTEQIQARTYESADHERRVVTLEDGSVIQLDVGTRIAVKMSRERREIDLLGGRALFEVAHDSSRPFSVAANGSRTTALGTKFQVEEAADRVVVTLTQGSVAVDGIAQRSGAVSWQERLRPGDQLMIDVATAERALHVVDTTLVTSWSNGRHVFRGTPLQDALDEVNRYATRKVRLGDASLATLPVAGNFLAGDSEVVVNAFSAVLPLRVVDGGEHEIILFRRYGE